MDDEARWQVSLERPGAEAPELVVQLEAGRHRVKLSMSMDEAIALAATIARLSGSELRPLLTARVHGAKAAS